MSRECYRPYAVDSPRKHQILRAVWVGLLHLLFQERIVPASREGLSAIGSRRSALWH
ncbi:MAG: hypothetical protein F6J93_16420 [Oscillatoria sp. SIO1A7]|nr:hypothetical protein [Oscillatoria sp. SIO1A7]